MASGNNQDEWKKSVEGVIGHVQQFLDADPTRNFTPSFVAGMLNRFRDAHNREVAELKDKSCKYAQKDGGCTAEDKSFQRTVELEREVAELRECLKETINAAADAMWWKRGCDKTRNVCTNCSEKDKTFPCPVKRWLKALEGGSYAGADCAISAVRNAGETDKDALGALADRLGKIRTPPTFYISRDGYRTACSDIAASSRILGEIAKVKCDGKGVPNWGESSRAIAKSREIAKEGK